MTNQVRVRIGPDTNGAYLGKRATELRNGVGGQELRGVGNDRRFVWGGIDGTVTK